MTTELPGLSSKVSQDITVRQPSNTNYIQNTGFFFNIQRLPSVQFFCQEVNLPAINFDAIMQTIRSQQMITTAMLHSPYSTVQ